MKLLRNGSMKGRILARVVSLIAVFSMICGFFPGGVLTVHAATTINLANLTANYEAQNGDVLTGELAGDYRIYVANGASITLNNATIAPPTNSVTSHAGISCMGDATIYIEGDNTVKGFDDRTPGIYVGDGYTLTINGTGKLTAEGSDQGCGIGGALFNPSYKHVGNITINSGTIIAIGPYNSAAGIGLADNGKLGTITINGGDVTARAAGGDAAGIGAAKANTDDEDYSHGNIIITGGTVHAYGGPDGAGIGAGCTYQRYNDITSSACGNITITGGTVYAEGGARAAGIGSGCTRFLANGAVTKVSTCGTITISGNDTHVTAKKGANAPNHIGAGHNSECDAVIIQEDLSQVETDEGLIINDPTQVWAKAEDVSCTYDGKSHGIKIKLVYPEGATVMYGTTEGTYDLTESPTITNASDSPLKVYYRVSKDGYNDFTGSATITIKKADQSAPSEPESASATADSITLKTIENGEYRLGFGEWQDSPVFAGLTFGNEYTFYQRYKEDENHNPSEVSQADIRLTHEHNWSFSAEGTVITATCGNTDGKHSGELTSTLTINRPLHASYGDGFAKEATVTGSIEGVAIPEVKYSRRGGQALAAAPEEVGRYTASITLGGATASVDYEIEGIEPYIITVPTASAIIYGQTLADSDLTGGSADVAGTFEWADGSVKPSVFDNDKTEYDVVFSPSAANYKSVTCKVKLGVSKAEPVVTAPVAKTLKYNGSGQELVNAGSTDGGTMYYAVLPIADAAPVESAYKSTVPTAKEAGTYYVWYKVIGDENHTDSDAASVKVTIGEAVPGEDPEPTPVYEITVSENETVSITIGVDGERELKADLGGQSISWSSSDEKVVTVTADGKIKAVWSGTAKVTGVAADGRSVVCEVTVAQKYDDDTADHVRVSPDDFNEFVRPEKQEHKRITKEAVSVTLKDGSNVKVDVSVNYINAVAYTGKVIKPADDLEVKYELDDILKAAGISDVKADELIKIKYTSRNKDANKNARFYAKFSVVGGAKKKFNLTNDQIKALKAILKEVNKAMKNEPISYTINKASLADMAEMKVNAKTKDGALRVKNGKLRGFKGVFVKYKSSDKKALKLKAKAGYDIEVIDAASAKIKVSGKKNYTGYVIKQANN